ncbi:hypothetical protein BpHYR1_044091 [Brachionus plicatilis]|uniref:Uncharacterized protein n=1 Tax=Brachionus plicatilis TaxID=10195 RepID=A0A3M7RP08_BRAPC|nr:hypothetical protein BpHYR1_044091 [Brachionus plicatilis]
MPNLSVTNYSSQQIRIPITKEKYYKLVTLKKIIQNIIFFTKQIYLFQAVITKIATRLGFKAYLSVPELVKDLLSKAQQLCHELTMINLYKNIRICTKQILNLSKYGKRINKFYIIGDNPEFDVRGANLKKENLKGENQIEVLQRLQEDSPNESILLCSGVYKPSEWHAL